MRQFLSPLWAKISRLRPDEVRVTAERPVSIGLHAFSAPGFAQMEEWLAPASISDAKRWQVAGMIHRAGDPQAPSRFDVELAVPGLARPGAIVFHPDDPRKTVAHVLAAQPELQLALARHFAPFREPVVDALIHTVCKENTLFSLATALPDIIPNLIELPWALAEFASDTAFITANQVRLAFQIAAASDHPVGYSHQKAAIASIMGGAFGWRAVARQIVGKIPYGGGLIPKAAIAYGGTYLAGWGLERFYRVGYGYSATERRAVYDTGYARGKEVALDLVRNLKRKKVEPASVRL